MDKVVQNNAAGTEELSSQSEELKRMVGILLEIVEGQNGAEPERVDANRRSGLPSGLRGQRSRRQAALPSPQKEMEKTSAKEVNSEDVIPFDEGDLKDFWQRS